MARVASLQFVSLLVVPALLATTKLASAQEAVAPGAISLTGPPAAPPAAAARAPAASPEAPPAKDASPEYAGNDHDLFVHHIAVGYFGISQLPVGTGGAAPGIVNAPVVGVRYWVSRLVGVDLGLGFGYSTTSETGVAASTDTWGFALHGGLPLSLAQSKHFSFEVVPIEATIGFTGGSNPMGMVNGPSASGLLFRAGARVGAELQFGFIGIPQLALEASLGLYVQHESYGVGNNSVNTTTFTTSVSSDPWAIFTDTISALYYF